MFMFFLLIINSWYKTSPPYSKTNENSNEDDLLNMDLEGKTIGVTRDIRSRKWVDTFNTGVMLLHPALSEYDNLVKLLMDEYFEFEYIMSDQGFLNGVYFNDWHEIGFLNNANLIRLDFAEFKKVKRLK